MNDPHPRRIKQILDAVITEWEYGVRKYDDADRSLNEWLAILQYELAEASDAHTLKRNPQGALREILQVVAVGIAALEQHGVVERNTRTVRGLRTPHERRNPASEGPVLFSKKT